MLLPGGEHNPVKTEGRGKYWGPVKNPELLSPSHLLFLISSTNTVIGTTNYNNCSLAETRLTESLLLLHEAVNIQVLRRSLLCASLLEYLNGLLLCHYLDFKCNYSQGVFFLTLASDGTSLVVSDSYCTNKQKQRLKETAT